MRTYFPLPAALAAHMGVINRYDDCALEFHIQPANINVLTSSAVSPFLARWVYDLRNNVLRFFTA